MDKKKEPGWQAFLRQYKDLMPIVLLVAALINHIFTGKWGTTGADGSDRLQRDVGPARKSRAAASLAALAGR